MQRQYLLDCIEAKMSNDAFVYEWLDAAHVLTECRMADAFRAAAPGARNRIETGALEHILETPALRPFFAFWVHDPVLREGYEAALQWGEAHERR